MVIDDKLTSGLKARAESGDDTVLKSAEIRSLFDQLKTLPSAERASFGQALNQLKSELEALLANQKPKTTNQKPIDVTAPWDVNSKKSELLPTSQGSVHPLMSELESVLDIYARMGFAAVESRQLDDDWHMFTSLNFPEDHPARDDYDTFMTWAIG